MNVLLLLFRRAALLTTRNSASSTKTFSPYLTSSIISDDYDEIDVVYVGQYSNTKRDLVPILKGVKNFCDLQGFNFTIYGHVWTNVEEEEVRRWRRGEDGVTLFLATIVNGLF